MQVAAREIEVAFEELVDDDHYHLVSTDPVESLDFGVKERLNSKHVSPWFGEVVHKEDGLVYVKLTHFGLLKSPKIAGTERCVDHSRYFELFSKGLVWCCRVDGNIS